jgi:hypothetical protein
VKQRKGQYPDNAALYARKAEGRRQRAAMSFAEKLDAVDRLRAGTAPVVRAREARKQMQQGTKQS